MATNKGSAPKANSGKYTGATPAKPAKQAEVNPSRRFRDRGTGS